MRIRIAVAVNDDEQQWFAYANSEHPERMPPRRKEERIVWVEAEIPPPPPPEIVEGEVV